MELITVPSYTRAADRNGGWILTERLVLDPMVVYGCLDCCGASGSIECVALLLACLPCAVKSLIELRVEIADHFVTFPQANFRKVLNF